MSRVLVALVVLLSLSGLAAAGIALSLSGTEESAAAHDAAHASHADGGDAPRVGTAPEGRIPTLEDALLRLERRASIVIRSDLDWSPAAGVRGGNGTPDDPYRITGYYVDTLVVADTTRCFEIAGNRVARILVLDWTGSCGLVHHNHVANLRTNRNVERTGAPTAAVITKNAIERVEELRHFDGALVDNSIGRAPLAAGTPLLGDARLPSRGVALDIAGLNGADISRNTIYGGVDMKLHGHHHSDGSGRHSHHHGASAERGPQDHTVRHVDFLFRDNVIKDASFGLRFHDLDHAADDRTATSEPEPALELPHVHYTTVRIVGNVVEGRGLRVSAFNAPDERHLGQAGRLVLEGNVLRGPSGGGAIVVQDVADAVVELRANRVERGDAPRIGETTGILLQRFTNATVLVADHALPGVSIGVRAREFDAATTWTVVRNSAPDARHPVYWDESVANAPTTDAER